MILLIKRKEIFLSLLLILFIIFSLSIFRKGDVQSVSSPTTTNANNEKKTYIKWAEFKVPFSLLDAAYKLDVETHDKEIHIDMISSLAYIISSNWGNVPKKPLDELNKLKEKLNSGKTIEELTKKSKLYPYYYEVYKSILSEYVGEYEIEKTNPDNENEIIIEKKYGLKVFSPIAKGYYYNDYNDFGASRDFGYKRVHLGHDLLGNIGTPVIAIEGGYIEALGWNRYGGWRIGIRSFDKKRYYYYAHLRKDHPYNKSLKVGDHVKAGDVIGYLGMTGYSDKENVNNISTPHLHVGIQLIFDESQKDGNNQIWIDVYNIMKLLEKQKSSVVKDQNTKEYNRLYNIFY